MVMLTIWTRLALEHLLEQYNPNRRYSFSSTVTISAEFSGIEQPFREVQPSSPSSLSHLEWR